MAPISCTKTDVHLNDCPRLEDKIQIMSSHTCRNSSTTADCSHCECNRKTDIDKSASEDDDSIKDDDVAKWQEDFSAQPARQTLEHLAKASRQPLREKDSLVN